MVSLPALWTTLLSKLLTQAVVAILLDESCAVAGCGAYVSPLFRTQIPFSDKSPLEAFL